MNFQIGICDDDSLFLKTLESSLHKYEQLHSLVLQIFSYESGEALLADYQNHHFNLLILDMEMTGLNGIEVAKELRKSDEDVNILYSTIHKAFAHDAYKVNAVSYLDKPLNDEELFKNLDIIFQNLRLRASFHDFKDKHLTLKSRQKVIQIPYSEILYMTKRRNTLTVHTKTGGDFVYMNIKDVRDLLDASIFVKINPGQIVNWTKITSFNDNLICLEDIELVASRQFGPALNKRYRQEIIASLRKKGQEI